MRNPLPGTCPPPPGSSRVSPRTPFIKGEQPQFTKDHSQEVLTCWRGRVLGVHIPLHREHQDGAGGGIDYPGCRPWHCSWDVLPFFPMSCPSGSGPGLVIQTVSYISHFRQLLLPSPTGPQRLTYKPSHPPNCCKRLSFRDYPGFVASIKQSSLPSRSRPQGIGQTELINTCRTLAL